MANDFPIPIPNENMKIEELIKTTELCGAMILLAQVILRKKLEVVQGTVSKTVPGEQ